MPTQRMCCSSINLQDIHMWTWGPLCVGLLYNAVCVHVELLQSVIQMHGRQKPSPPTFTSHPDVTSGIKVCPTETWPNCAAVKALSSSLAGSFHHQSYSHVCSVLPGRKLQCGNFWQGYSEREGVRGRERERGCSGTWGLER